MNKPSLFIVALLSLVFAPSCRNLYFWRKDKPEPVVTKKSEKPEKKKKVKEKERVSGAAGWGIDVEKE